ncbi:hypothetical protein ElyMa_000216100 [Elysia marginata]|uniref:DUF5641 domain-containing protein n=1 Tax=Elysia marginata TaxID=1093978 RepID=A0AAV4EZ45_9GAST|nr:hypothetical protein ElyMa_000216100 [Elysia marginata]
MVNSVPEELKSWRRKWRRTKEDGKVEVEKLSGGERIAKRRWTGKKMGKKVVLTRTDGAQPGLGKVTATTTLMSRGTVADPATPVTVDAATREVLPAQTGHLTCTGYREESDERNKRRLRYIGHVIRVQKTDLMSTALMGRVDEGLQEKRKTSNVTDGQDYDNHWAVSWRGQPALWPRDKTLAQRSEGGVVRSLAETNQGP